MWFATKPVHKKLFLGNAHAVDASGGDCRMRRAGLAEGSIPVKTLSEFIARAKLKPGLSHGSAGAGSPQHLDAEMLRAAAGSTPDSFVTYVKTEVDRWAAIVRNPGAELE
jgi:tripartite-type tricarboxylate transporter receptor subunit TctC